MKVIPAMKERRIRGFMALSQDMMALIWEEQETAVRLKNWKKNEEE